MSNASEFSKRLAGVRHDLRNPVGQVLGYGEMIDEELDGVNAALFADFDNDGDDDVVLSFFPAHRADSTVFLREQLPDAGFSCRRSLSDNVRALG